jgi:Rrf2 family protein
MGLRLTQGADYAVRAMIHIASLPDGKPAMRRDIARVQKIPADFVAKILQSLVRAGLLRSSRGTGGGFSLARTRDEISLLDVVEAIEGPLAVVACADGPGGCDHSAFCPADAIWKEVQRRISDVLRGATLETMVSARMGRAGLQPPAMD